MIALDNDARAIAWILCNFKCSQLIERENKFPSQDLSKLHYYNNSAIQQYITGIPFFFFFLSAITFNFLSIVILRFIGSSDTTTAATAPLLQLHDTS